MDPAAVAQFLRSCPGLNKQTTGELLGEYDEFFLEVLRFFTDTFDFTGDTRLKSAYISLVCMTALHQLCCLCAFRQLPSELFDRSKVYCSRFLRLGLSTACLAAITR